MHFSKSAIFIIRDNENTTTGDLLIFYISV